MCELDLSGSAEGLVHESCEHVKQQCVFVKNFEFLN